MKRNRFTEDLITMALRQAETGTSVAEIRRRFQVTEQTFYRWRRKNGSMVIVHVAALFFVAAFARSDSLAERFTSALRGYNRTSLRAGLTPNSGPECALRPAWTRRINRVWRG